MVGSGKGGFHKEVATDWLRQTLTGQQAVTRQAPRKEAELGEPAPQPRAYTQNRGHDRLPLFHSGSLH